MAFKNSDNARQPSADLLKYCNTEKQRKVLELWIELGTSKAVANQLDVSETTVRRVKATVAAYAAKRGYTETFDATRFVDPGQVIVGKSTFTKDDEGNPVWIKTKAEIEDQRKAFFDFIEGLLNYVEPVNPKKAENKKRNKDIMPAIFIGDAHIGMRADGSETRDRSFDSRIAKEEICVAISDLVSVAPEADTGLLVNVGDFVHANNSNATTAKGTPLDVDTRYEKFMRVAAETLVYSIDTMLTKFKNVQVVIARGNHDPDAAIALQMILEFYYSKEPRVNVLRSKGFFHYLRFGKWLIGVHHGDKVKAQKLASIMPRDMPDAWAETTHRMWAVGHFHHAHELECDNSVIVKKFGTLAPPDAWHSSQGYGSSHVMEMIVFKREGGKMLSYTYEIPKEHKGVDVEIL